MLCCLQLLTVAVHAMLFTMLTVTVHAVLFTMLAVVVYATMLFTTMLTAPHPLPNLPTASTGLNPLATAPVSCNPVHGPGTYSTVRSTGRLRQVLIGCGVALARVVGGMRYDPPVPSMRVRVRVRAGMAWRVCVRVRWWNDIACLSACFARYSDRCKRMVAPQHPTHPPTLLVMTVNTEPAMAMAAHACVTAWTDMA